jgi:hypothetical protein
VELPKEVQAFAPGDARTPPSRRRFRTDAEEETAEELHSKRLLLQEMTKNDVLKQRASKILTIVIDNQLTVCFTFWRGLALKHTEDMFGISDKERTVVMRGRNDTSNKRTLNDTDGAESAVHFHGNLERRDEDSDEEGDGSNGSGGQVLGGRGSSTAKGSASNTRRTHIRDAGAVSGSQAPARDRGGARDGRGGGSGDSDRAHEHVSGEPAPGIDDCLEFAPLTEPRATSSAG